METVENPYDKVRRKMVAARIEFMSQLAKFNQDGNPAINEIRSSAGPGRTETCAERG